MMCIDLPNGQRVHSPPPSKSNLGLEHFVKLFDVPGAKLVMFDVENPDVMERIGKAFLERQRIAQEKVNGTI